MIENKYPKKDSLVLPKLWEYQERHGWISNDNMKQIAKELDKTPIEIYSVASFYTMFKLKPMGKNHIEICKTLSCSLCGCKGIKNTLEDKLGIKVGDTTSDNRFTLSEVECLGACDKSPVVSLNGEYYYNVDDKQIENILKDSL
jgi:NADH-quinone oxidoreductase subunit E